MQILNLYYFWFIFISFLSVSCANTRLGCNLQLWAWGSEGQGDVTIQNFGIIVYNRCSLQNWNFICMVESYSETTFKWSLEFVSLEFETCMWMYRNTWKICWMCNFWTHPIRKSLWLEMAFRLTYFLLMYVHWYSAKESRRTLQRYFEVLCFI